MVVGGHFKGNFSLLLSLSPSLINNINHEQTSNNYTNYENYGKCSYALAFMSILQFERVTFIIVGQSLSIWLSDRNFNISCEIKKIRNLADGNINYDLI